MKLIRKLRHRIRDGIINLQQRKRGELTEYVWDDVHYNRVALINHACQLVNADSYLEIGCNKFNLSFDAVAVQHKIGVDPCVGGTHRMTSDQFFDQNTEKFDVIFVDGLHIWQQVRRDVVNGLQALKPNGFIFIHDMMPLSHIEAYVPQKNPNNYRPLNEWCGDVWKLAFELAATSDLNFRLATTDHGVGILRPNKDFNGQVVDLTDQLADKDYTYFYDHHRELPLMEALTALDWMKDLATAEQSA